MPLHSALTEEPRFELPPPPEDHFVLAGDILSLFTYSFIDHSVYNDMAGAMMNSLDSTPKLLEAAEQVPAIGNMPDWGIPVWLDPHMSYSSHVLQVTLRDRLVASYSPVLEPVGLATCLLATCWLTAGWWHRSFAFAFTTSCSTTRALTKTAQTWMTSTALMVSVVTLSHTHTHTVLTRGDMAYIVDSLTVLILWRFLANSILGTGKDVD